MDTSQKYFDPQALAKLRGLRLQARHVVEGLMSGLHRSPWRGFSIEFAEHREYTPGDDLRRLDWKAFGRTDKLYLKQYEDETNLICYLVVDGSESMTYRGPGSAMSKWEYARLLATSLAWLVINQGDAVGLATFSDSPNVVIPPSGTASQWQRVVGVLDDLTPGNKTAAGPIFHELAERFTKRGVVVILSDMFADVSSIVAGLKHMRYRRHDVVVLQVLDRAELEFPFRDQTVFHGLEQMPEVTTDPAALRAAYLEEFDRFRQSLIKGCRSWQIGYELMPSDRPFDDALAGWLAGR